MENINNTKDQSWLSSVASVENLPGINARAAFVSSSCDVFRETGDISPVSIDDTLSYMPWGIDNRLPYDVLDLIDGDETMTTCLQFTAELCYGSGLRYNTDECSNTVRTEIRDFYMDNPIASYYMGMCQDLKHFAWAVSMLILNAEGTKIVRIQRKEACYCRMSVADKQGKISKILYSNWRNNTSPRREDIEEIELLDPASPWRDLAIRMGRIPGADGMKSVRTKQRKFALLTKIPTADSTYYPIPFYASLFRSKWYDIKRLIGVAKESKLKNSAPIKYQIEISDRYWTGIFKAEGITDRRKQQERIVKEKESMLEFLTGAENSGKALFSSYYISPDGKEQHEVLITKIDGGKEGGDWESDIQESVNMICFAMRVHSNLVGSVPGKAQTNNSGSDKRELYTIAQALQKPYHDLLFLPHEIIIRYNGWDGAYPECPMIQLTTLDEKRDAKEVTTNIPQ